VANQKKDLGVKSRRSSRFWKQLHDAGLAQAADTGGSAMIGFEETICGEDGPNRHHMRPRRQGAAEQQAHARDQTASLLGQAELGVVDNPGLLPQP